MPLALYIYSKVSLGSFLQSHLSYKALICDLYRPSLSFVPVDPEAAEY